MGAKSAGSKKELKQFSKENLGLKLLQALEAQSEFKPQGNDDIVKKLQDKGYKQIYDLWDDNKKGASITV